MFVNVIMERENHRRLINLLSANSLRWFLSQSKQLTKVRFIMTKKDQLSNVRKGDLVTVTFENRQFDVIVIDPHGLGKYQPSLGFGQNMMEKHGGLPQPTSSKWIKQGDSTNDNKTLETPTGKSFKVITVKGLDNNIYQVLEISNWVAVAIEALKAKGKNKISDSVRDKLLDFLGWFAVKGLYADAYTQLKGNYTARDSRALTRWQETRYMGKAKRHSYTDLLQSQGCYGKDYGYWTNVVYLGLFGRTACQMRAIWQCVDGHKHIARNYISEEDGLKAVAHVEFLVPQLFIGNLKDAHDTAIKVAQTKFNLV